MPTCILPLAPMLAELREFTGLPHRCELVGDSAGVRFINDSKATNTGATLAALQGLAEGRNIVLIAGGEGQAVAVDNPQNRAQAEDDEDLHQHRQHVLRADHAAVEERQPGRHEQDERRRNEHPRGVTGIHGAAI